jgi:AraC family transcriptional regulator
MGEAQQMQTAAERAVERVVAAMRSNLGEQLTIDDMARVAMFSKFHFSRMFQRVTGVSPGRFLSALRLQEAKQLLVSTSFNVSDISLRVGYTSVGTFSSRFTRSVGLSPTTYRRLGGYAAQIDTAHGEDTSHQDGDPGHGTVSGMVWPTPARRPQLTFIGLFADRIPEGRPVSCTILDHAGPYVLDKVPTGSWYLLAHAVTAGTEDVVDDGSDVAVATHGPVIVRRDTLVDNTDVKLKPMRTLDPPVLLALLDVRKAALERAEQHAFA